MFVNFSNHSSHLWTPMQKIAAQAYGEIIDLPFPAVSPDASADEIIALATEYTDLICSMTPSAVLCQGEYTLAFAVVSRLKQRGVTVFAACSKRRVDEYAERDTTRKTSVFEFRQLREYTY